MNASADDLQYIIQQGRSARADWFTEETPVEAIATTMMAMANSQGGMILVGAREQNITGVRDKDSAIDRLLQAALSCDPPLIIPLPKVVQVDQQMVIAAHIPTGMPHVYSLNGRYLQRQNSENTPLNLRELRRLMIERGETSFEAEITPGATLEDIDWEKARHYATNLSGIGETDVEKVLLKRGCLAAQDNQLRPTNAGILLFGKDPQRHIRGAEITAVRFAGDTMSDTFSRQDIIGTLPDQIRRAETFLVDHLRKGVHLRHTMTREETFEYPLEAARELVVNAVAHRDYSIRGDGIRLFIFSNRMEITSPGKLPGPVTIDNIKDERFSRNSAVVQVLADMGFIERLGYGVDRVIDLMEQQKLDAPEFEETAGGFRVVLRNQPLEAQPSTSETITELRGEYKGIVINPRQEAAIVYLKREGSSRITNSDLQQLCPDVHPETIRRDLSDLVTKDILKKMGEKRGSYYVMNE
jgi:ATP-dependent DNA helicase RecG